ncbi:MAG: chemotaxis protein CheW [Deltaproteobacteria bacterium]|nr:chemotaxis protein CheW [Deltaproteobacteria bacterium]MBW2413069.1 chemotaxis protein CheW [Deltaproteobacteria bacterium]
MSGAATVIASETRLCTFYLGDERYGIDILTVREVQRGPVVTAVRGAHRAIRGLVNLRGRVVTVLDPAVQLGHDERPLDAKTRLVILKTNAELPRVEGAPLETGDDRVGLCVDRISDVHTVEAGGIDPLPMHVSGSEGRLSGVVQLEDEVIRVMDPAAMLRLEEDERA